MATILVVGDGVWGRGNTEEEAVNKARAAGHYGRRKLLKYLVYECDDADVRLDSMGYLCYKEGQPPRLVKEVGTKPAKPDKPRKALKK